MKRHSFAVCAYNESPYLEKCIISLINQKYKDETDIIMCTSTPNAYIQGIADKYGVPLIVNPDKGDIQTDWNFAYNYCDSQYITLAHQDDIYDEHYTERLIAAANKYDDIVIFFSSYRALVTYGEIAKVRNDINCILRNTLSFLMRFPAFQNKSIWKKAILKLGCSICCSSVTYNKKIIGNENVFRSELKSSLDWDTFLTLAPVKGRFYGDGKVLTYFRIHQKSTSMLCIENELREKEDYIMFCKMWPRFIARILMSFYKLAYKNYKKLKREQPSE